LRERKDKLGGRQVSYTEEGDEIPFHTRGVERGGGGFMEAKKPVEKKKVKTLQVD